MRANEVQTIAVAFATTAGFINRLLDGGIASEDIQDVLEIRNDREGAIELASASILIEFYRLAGGDTRMMSIALDRAIDRVGDGDANSLLEATSFVAEQGLNGLLYGEGRLYQGVPWWCGPDPTSDELREAHWQGQ